MRQFHVLGAFAALAALTVPIAALVSNSSINSQMRLAYAGDTGMMVSWNTFSKIDNPTVLYGFSPGALVYSASSKISVTYPTSLTYNNHVKITGLKPDTLYYYMPTTLIQGNEPAGPYSFRTSRPAGDQTPYSIAIVVDLGTMGSEGLSTSAGKGVSPNNVLAPGEINTIQSLSTSLSEFDFLWHPGDIAYADYWLKEELQGYEPNTTIADGYTVYESILEEFYDEMTPITVQKPYMVGPGNHEANCDNGGTGGYTASICVPGQTNFTGYINHFRMPSDESGGLGNFWYSFDHGMTHYIQFDTETDLGHGLVGPDEPAGGTEDAGPFGLMNQQINWLTADLAAVDRTVTPWIVVSGHRPYYASGAICANCKTAFEPLFIEYNVDLVLHGHFHVYQRNAPIANGVADPKELNNPSSPWYIINGCAGHYDGLDSFTLPLQSFQRFGLDTNNATYGWSKLTFHNCTHLTHEFIASNNGSVLDSATLYKNRVCSSGGSSTTSSSSSTTTSHTGSATTSASISSSKSTSATVSSSISMTTSVVYTTKLITITSCAPTVTNCPARVITSTIVLYTTTCPVTVAQTTSTHTTPPPVMTTSVVYTTIVFTTTLCAPTVTNCPATSTQVVTSTIALHTTAVAVSTPAVASTPAAVSQVSKSAAVGASTVASSSKTTTAAPALVTGTANTVSSSVFILLLPLMAAYFLL